MELCDGNCDECPVVNHPNSRMLTKILNDAKDEFGGRFYLLVENNCPNMTVCYDCRFDNFTHAESCKFAKSSDNKREIPSKIKEWIEELKSFRDVGDTFTLRGVEHIVTGHSITRSFFYHKMVFPVLTTNYIGDNNEIKEAEFPISKLPILIKQNEVKMRSD